MKYALKSLAPWTAALLALGVLLRLRQYLFNRSLWLDEAYLAVSFVDRSLGELLLEPLANNQAAPLGFLLLVKLATMAGGVHDWTLRLVPLISGVTGLFLAVPLARSVLPGTLARNLFVALLACSPVLVYYSSEFKQYQGDLLCSVLILWLGARFQPGRAWRDGLLLGVVGAACIWLSHSSLFVLAGTGTVLWIEMGRQRHRQAWLAVSVAGLLWLISFAINHTLSLRGLSANPSLTGFWELAYAPVPPRSLQELGWYLESALGLVYLALRHTEVAHHGVMPQWFDALNAALLLLTAAGAAALAGVSRRVAGIFLVTLLAVLAASALHLYPFRSRLILFMLPFVFLSLAALVHRIEHQTRFKPARKLALGVSVVLAGVALAPGLKALQDPYNGHDIKGAMAYVATHRQSGDSVMLSTWTHKAYDFYNPGFELDDMPLVMYRQTVNVDHDALATVRRICLEPSSGRTWLIISHRLADQGKFLRILNALSRPLSSWQGDGAAAFLYDFRPSAYCKRYRQPA